MPPSVRPATAPGGAQPGFFSSDFSGLPEASPGTLVLPLAVLIRPLVLSRTASRKGGCAEQTIKRSLKRQPTALAVEVSAAPGPEEREIQPRWPRWPFPCLPRPGR